jgi:hypothetical protein
MALIAPAPPEQGQLVDVRQRRYVVTDVLRSALPGDPLRAPGHNLQHLVSLDPVEDDTIGEKLQVLGRIALGTAVNDLTLGGHHAF